MTKRIVKVFSIILVLLLVVYVGFQIYMIAYPTYTTEIAMINAVDDSIPATGIVVRDETVISTSATGVRNYLINNGDKVAKDSTVAEIYDTPQDALDNLSLQMLQNELDILQKTADGGRTAGTNLESLNARIYRQLFEVSSQITQGQYANVSADKLQLMDLFNSYSVALGDPMLLEERIAEIEARIAALNERDFSPSGTIETPVEGYFISSVDGMEGLVNRLNVRDMSVEQIVQLAKGEEAALDTTACKVVSDYVWYYAAVIDSKYEDRFSAGTKLTLDFNYALVTSLPATVVAVTTDAALKKTVVLLECTLLNSSIAELRCETAQLSFRNFSGFIVDRSALHMVEGEVGVFVKEGSAVAFKKIEIVYETNDYIVSKANIGDAEYLRLYDEILVAGKDLEVGKSLA